MMVKFLDELKKRQVIARKRGYGPNYVNLFIKHHKEKMLELARCLHQNLEEELQGLKSSQDHVVKESIACRSEPADSDSKLRIGFLQISPVDNDEDYDSTPGRNMSDSTKRKRLESKLS